MLYTELLSMSKCLSLASSTARFSQSEVLANNIASVKLFIRYVNNETLPIGQLCINSMPNFASRPFYLFTMIRFS